MGRCLAVLTGVFFKATEDGGRLFFPYGILGPAYIVRPSGDFARLFALILIYCALFVVGVCVGYGVAGIVGTAVTVPLLVVAYAVSVQVQCRSLVRAQILIERSACTAALTCMGFIYLMVWSVGTALMMKRRVSNRRDDSLAQEGRENRSSAAADAFDSADTERRASKSEERPVNGDAAMNPICEAAHRPMRSKAA